MKILMLLKRTLFIILSLTTSAVYASSPVENFESKLSIALDKFKTHKSFSLQFTQEFYSAMRDKVITSNGELLVKVPHSFRFEMKVPREELYVSNGVDFWKYVPELKHAQHLAASSLELNYLSLLTNPNNIKQAYNMTPWTDEEAKSLQQSSNLPSVQSDYPPAETAKDVLVKLEPKGDKPQKVLYAIINIKEGLVEELRVVQLNGNRVRLLFSKYENKKFDEKNFSFDPPSGIMVNQN